MSIIWELKDLPELRIGDNVAFKAEGLQKPFVRLIGAETWHWGMVGQKVVNDTISEGDYSVFDSTNKGITAHLLSEYQHRHMRVYRPKLSIKKQAKIRKLLMKRYYLYGTDHYDWKGVIMVGAWCILRKLGLNVEWWEHDDNKLYCLEFNEVVIRPFIHLTPENEPPYPANMEQSSNLKIIWGTF